MPTDLFTDAERSAVVRLSNSHGEALGRMVDSFNAAARQSDARSSGKVPADAARRALTQAREALVRSRVVVMKDQQVHAVPPISHRAEGDVGVEVIRQLLANPAVQQAVANGLKTKTLKPVPSSTSATFLFPYEGIRMKLASDAQAHAVLPCAVADSRIGGLDLSLGLESSLTL